MKVILRDKTTGFFYSPHGEWVLDARYAFDFGDVNRAEMFVTVERLFNVEVILKQPQASEHGQ